MAWLSFLLLDSYAFALSASSFSFLNSSPFPANAPPRLDYRSFTLPMRSSPSCLMSLSSFSLWIICIFSSKSYSTFGGVLGPTARVYDRRKLPPTAEGSKRGTAPNTADYFFFGGSFGDNLGCGWGFLADMVGVGGLLMYSSVFGGLAWFIEACDTDWLSSSHSTMTKKSFLPNFTCWLLFSSFWIYSFLSSSSLLWF